MESPQPHEYRMIVRFDNDPKEQRFEVRCKFMPWNDRLRIYDHLEVTIKWESEIITDPETGNKGYFTHLICEKVRELPDN